MLTVKDLKEILNNCKDDDVLSIWDVETGNRYYVNFIDDGISGHLEFNYSEQEA